MALTHTSGTKRTRLPQILTTHLKRLSLGLLLILVLTPILSVLSTRVHTPARVYAATVSTLNFQARLLNAGGAIVPDGTYSVQFRLYDGGTAGGPVGPGQANSGTGGVALWTETQAAVTVKAGYLSVHLGSSTIFPGTIDWSQEHWLTMNVNADGEMNPRLKLTAVPYAFRAGQADTLKNGASTITADGLAQLAPASAQTINSALPGLRINQTGVGGLLQLSGSGTDVFTLSNIGNGFLRGVLDIDGASLNIGSVTQAGSVVLEDGAGRTGTLNLAGGLTLNRTYSLPDVSGTVCLTTTCAGAANGFINGGNLFGGTAVLGTNDIQALQFETSGLTRLTVLSGGNVGVGETNPGALFSVGTGSPFQVNNTGGVTAVGLASSGALSITAGGASISGGLNNNSGGITNSGSITGVGTNITGSAGLTLGSGGVGDLTLDSASNKLVIAGTDTSLQRTGAGSFTLDLNDGAATTFVLNNSGLGSASLNLNDGGLQLAGTQVFSNARALANLTSLSSAGTVTFSSLSAGGLVKSDVSGNLSIAISGTDYEVPLTISNGLTRTGNAVRLGGNLTAATDIGLNANNLTFTGSASSVTTLLAAGGLEVRTDSTAALSVRSVAGTSFFTVNTTGNFVQVGSSTTDATAILSVLDSFNNVTDPTGVNGGSYYNTGLNKMRCYENSAWKDCITSAPDTGVFEDITAAAWAGDNQTVQLFNDATKPNIITKLSTSTVLISVHISGLSNTAADAFFAARVVFTTNGVDPTCASTQVGRSMISGFTTNTTHPYQLAGSFIHNPGVAGTIKYTVCSSDDAFGTTLTDNADNITVSLVELGS